MTHKEIRHLIYKEALRIYTSRLPHHKECLCYSLFIAVGNLSNEYFSISEIYANVPSLFPEVYAQKPKRRFHLLGLWWPRDHTKTRIKVLNKAIAATRK